MDTVAIMWDWYLVLFEFLDRFGYDVLPVSFRFVVLSQMNLGDPVFISMAFCDGELDFFICAVSNNQSINQSINRGFVRT